jgi:hypothetical protein
MEKIELLTDKECNELLKKYDRLIVEGVSRIFITGYFLNSRCITKDDIIQEVRIKVWQLLKYKYDGSTDLETFILFQSSWNAVKICSNLYRSSSSFFGSRGKQGKGSQQSQIDNNKFSISNHIDNYLADNLLEARFENLIDSSYMFYGLDIDMEYLIKEVNKQIDFLTTKENTKIIYKAIFNSILTNPKLFNDKNMCNDLAEEYKYTYAGINLIIKKLQDIILDVLIAYNKE